jgi:hypothetical protein
VKQNIRRDKIILESLDVNSVRPVLITDIIASSSPKTAKRNTGRYI